MLNLDPIFEYQSVYGYQDIWFRGLKPSEVAHLFNHACHAYGHGNQPEITYDSDSDLFIANDQLPDIFYEFSPLRINDIDLDGVIIRIEDNQMAIDFGGGIEYWNTARQYAFIHWLRLLWKLVPHAKLDWSHEGHSRQSDQQTELLRLAVIGNG